MGICQGQRVQQEVQKRMTDYVRRNLFSPAQYQRIVVSKIPYVGDAPDQWLNHDRKCSRPRRVQYFAQVCRRNEDYLRYRIMQPLNFAIVNWLDLPPQTAAFLFLIIIGQDFAECFE